MPTRFDRRADELISTLRNAGQYKHLQVIDGPMDAVVKVRLPDGRFRETLCFCSNNYLGLANHPEVVEAGIKGLKDFGAGTASVRFICGTFTAHEELEERIARYMGTQAAYTFVSAWTANEAVFPTACEPGDLIISDELNHACIIDSVRLATTIKKGIHKSLYKNNCLRGENSLEQRLTEATANKDVSGQIWVVTDGVFSMEGSVADLPTMRKLCDAADAILVVDDSHGHGVMGKLGRGTHEHWDMSGDWETTTYRDGRDPGSRPTDVEYRDGRDSGSRPTDVEYRDGRDPGSRPTDVEYRDGRESKGGSGETVYRDGRESGGRPVPGIGKNGRVDVFTGTLGKALGGGAGGFVAADKRFVELMVQRGRPTLFSNALPATVARSASKAIEIVEREPERVAKLRSNVAYARKAIRGAGFDVAESPTAICPVIVHDTAKAIAMSKRLLEMGVFVIGFGYPVVPEGHARLRCQISAAHTTAHIDALVDGLKRL